MNDQKIRKKLFQIGKLEKEKGEGLKMCKQDFLDYQGYSKQKHGQ